MSFTKEISDATLTLKLTVLAFVVVGVVSGIAAALSAPLLPETGVAIWISHWRMGIRVPASLANSRMAIGVLVGLICGTLAAWRTSRQPWRCG